MENKESLQVLEGLDIDKMAELSAEHFTKPEGMSDKDFISKMKEELLEGGIKVKAREIIFERRFAVN